VAECAADGTSWGVVVAIGVIRATEWPGSAQVRVCCVRNGHQAQNQFCAESNWGIPHDMTHYSTHKTLGSNSIFVAKPQARASDRLSLTIQLPLR